MGKVVQAKCPGCEKVLHIRVEWLGATMRCRHCGMVFRARSKAAARDPDEVVTPHPGTESTPLTIPPTPPPPTRPASDAAPLGEEEFSFARLDAGHSEVTERYRRKTSRRPRVIITAAGALLAVIVGIACFTGWRVKGGGWWEKNSLISPPSTLHSPPSTLHPPPLPVAAPVVFPRRFLAISVSNYLYANPVNYGSVGDDDLFAGPGAGTRPDRSGHAVFTRLADALHVANDQRAELSDSAPGGAARPPLKAVIENTIRDFLGSSRAQDRILLMFVGHAVELGEQAYLVPLEGELDKTATLIPLAWLYEQLSKCKARQKALIIDVCRLDPTRGPERPASGPMGPKLDATLKNPPAGVQVWSACVAGQHSYEGLLALASDFDSGGFFLNELCQAVGPYEKKRVPLGTQGPADPLPLDVLAKGHGKMKGVNGGTEAEAAEIYKGKQTPRLAGAEAGGGAIYSPAEPTQKVVIRMPEAPAGGVANKELIAGILKDVDRVAPLRRVQQGHQHLRPETLTFFAAKKMEAYKDDAAESPFRDAVKKTLKVLASEQIATSFMEELRWQGGGAAMKERILSQQRKPAILQADLEEALAELQKAGKGREKEPSKRWQANYDYVLALLEARIAYVYEYNYMLGQIRKDALPTRDPAVHSGWRLATQEKLQSGSEAKKMAAASRKLLEKIAEDHQGTPYEVLAKREKLNALGLAWQPTR